MINRRTNWGARINTQMAVDQSSMFVFNVAGAFYVINVSDGGLSFQ